MLGVPLGRFDDQVELVRAVDLAGHAVVLVGRIRIIHARRADRRMGRFMKVKRAKVDAEFRFRPDRVKRVLKSERHLAKPEQTKPENCKVRVTICLDADIVEVFKRRASGPMAVPYQT